MSKTKKAPPVDDITALKEATREAHEVLKAVRQETKKLEDLRKQISKDICEHFRQHVDGVVAEGLAGYDRELKEAIDKGTDAVHKRFDDLANMFMGTSARDRKLGHPPLEEILRVTEWVRNKDAGLSGAEVVVTSLG